MDDCEPDCVICLEQVKAVDASWQCTSCYLLCHVVCVQRFAATQLNLSSWLIGELLGKSNLQWTCPHCRAVFDEAQYPAKYRCFCGKREDPAPDPWLPPHSCGETCGRVRPCGHKDVDRCHPGPCAKCTQVAPMPCFCGRTVRTLRCGAPRPACGQTCSRAGPARCPSRSDAAPHPAYLDRCEHACAQPCHDGDCPPCGILVDASCACGAETRRLPCAARVWRCQRECPNKLACGRHACPLGCHSGPCPPCPNVGARPCGCGKVTVAGLPCDAPTPRCGETCGRAMACGVHTCERTCHEGACGPCMVPVEGPCRCGRTRKRHLCSEGEEALLCAYRCEALRSCGRHACRKRCCNEGAADAGSGAGGSSAAVGEPAAAGAHVCRERCTRKLGCGLHACNALCHAGSCPPCPLTVTLSCACGGTRRTFPCGKAPKALVCRLPCQRVPTCHHRERQRHPCHSGPCPPCTQVCGAALSRCGHTCPLPCHSEAAPSADAPAPAAVPAAGAGAAFPVLRSASSSDGGDARKGPTPCAPCAVPVERRCVGGHEARSLPCAAPALFKCSRPCGGGLPCGHHTCERPCHARPLPASADAPAAAAAGAGAPSVSASCGSCGKPCEQPRPAGCSHPCSAGACHAGSCPPCVEPVSLRCRCGRERLSVPCNLAAAAAGGHVTTLAAADPLSCKQRCHRSLPNCTHLCGAVCHSGPCEAAYACDKPVTVRCPCGSRKEQWACPAARAAVSGAGAGLGAVPASADSRFTLLPCVPGECKPPDEGQAVRSRAVEDDAEDDVALGRGKLSAEAWAAAKTDRAELRRRRKAAEEEQREVARAAEAEQRQALAAAARKRSLILQVVFGALLAALVLWLVSLILSG